MKIKFINNSKLVYFKILFLMLISLSLSAWSTDNSKSNEEITKALEKNITELKKESYYFTKTEYCIALKIKSPILVK